MPGEQQEGQVDEAQPAVEVAGKDLILHLGGGGGSDSTPPDPKAQRLKSWANIIATTAALVTAVGALIRPQDQTATKNAYEQLKTSIEQTNQNVQSNHDDVVALHNYLQGYFASNAQVSLPPLSGSSGGGSSGFSSGSGGPAPSTSSTARRPPPYTAAPTTTATMAYAPSQASPAFPLPPVASNVAPPPLPPFDSVAAKK
jgi:hypothetical protein